ncbi:MAG: hypothetical protein J0I21_06985 [Alphaproteobacteria bacterium]|nr:hypothetical protein [Alphaproteobacteria bacterium]
MLFASGLLIGTAAYSAQIVATLADAGRPPLRSAVSLPPAQVLTPSPQGAPDVTPGATDVARGADRLILGDDRHRID